MKTTTTKVKKIDRVDMRKVYGKYPPYARREKLAHGRGQGKRFGKQVMGGMATVGLSIRIPDYGKQFGVSGEDLEELKSMSSDPNEGLMLLVHYAKARYAGYDHAQAATYAFMKMEGSPPSAIAEMMNKAENPITWTPMDWAREYAGEFVDYFGADFIKEQRGKYPGVIIEMDTRKIIDFMNRRGDWKIAPIGTGASLYEDFLMQSLHVYNGRVRMMIQGIGKTNVIVHVKIGDVNEDWKMRRKSRVKVSPR